MSLVSAKAWKWLLGRIQKTILGLKAFGELPHKLSFFKDFSLSSFFLQGLGSFSGQPSVAGTISAARSALEGFEGAARFKSERMTGKSIEKHICLPIYIYIYKQLNGAAFDVP